MSSEYILCPLLSLESSLSPFITLTPNELFQFSIMYFAGLFLPSEFMNSEVNIWKFGATSQLGKKKILKTSSSSVFFF